MADISTVDKIAAKWSRVTPQRTTDYEEGVRSPTRDWQRNTAAAVESYKAGITASIAAGSFAKGVSRAGNNGWQEGAITKGVGRWGPGVQVAQEKYQKAFAPYVDAIKRLVLPPRFARRDPRNMERVRAVAEALSKVRASAG